ncbi:MAG: hypothetical protein ACRD9S_25835 [Pyrinomonadaceae bacterium]
MPLNHSSKYAQLTDEQYLAIGKATVEWSNVEFLLGVLLSRLLATPEFLARTYTDIMTVAKIQEAITEAISIQRHRYCCKLVSKDVLTDIENINGRITAVRGKRNKLAHFCLCRVSDDKIFGTGFAGGIPDTKKHRRDNVTFELSELVKLYREAYDIVGLLGAIIENLPRIEEEAILTLHSTGAPRKQGAR